MPGIWHNSMEARFPAYMSEIKFFCSVKNNTNNTNNTCRIADVLLSNKRTCEIQHSFISSEEIEKRFYDWDTFGKEIIWLVDGNEDVDCEQMSSGNYLINFNKAWKYKSFIKNYKYILLEISGKVFKIELAKIKCKMLELKEYKHIDEVVEILKTKPECIWDKWSEDNVIKSRLTVHQQGAGNGKTYGIWKSIAENIDKKTFIIVTKQHSAKNVIYEELNDQSVRQEYHIENLTQKTEEHTEKHFVIKYIHKISKRECTVIIGTIDSFCFNLSSSSEKGTNLFEGILTTIQKSGMSKITSTGFMKFGNQTFALNKYCEIWIDEAQDLSTLYLYAMTRLMLDTNCDIQLVGDKLQTLEYEDNFLTSVRSEGLPNIDVCITVPVNINRRIQVQNMYQHINKLVNFAAYNLPEISLSEISLSDLPTNELATPLEIIESPSIYANDKDDTKVNNYVKKIMEKVEYEIKNNNYTPENFMFIFPIMKGNTIADELETKLQHFWIEKFKDPTYIQAITNTYWKTYEHNAYTQYVYLHKHTEGMCINTNDSLHATRIMSIRTSKGDGREVVFILGTLEKSLKLVSNQEIGLVYESYLHVALTRAKRKIYFGLVQNNDEIHRRFGECGYVEYLPPIKTSVSIEQLMSKVNTTTLIALLERNNITFTEVMEAVENDATNNKPTAAVDWGYHCIKYNVYYIKVILYIVNNNTADNSNFKKSHLAVVLDKLAKIKITTLNTEQFYEFLNKHQYCKKECCQKGLCEFPLCNLSGKPKYKEYCNKIETTIKQVQKHIQLNTLNVLTVYESIILVYMIQVYSQMKYAVMNPVDIYNITHFFETNTHKEHELLSTLANVENMLQRALNDATSENNYWNVFKHIALKGMNDDFNIRKMDFPIIGTNETTISHIILKSDFSALNCWTVLIGALLERFLIYNSKSDNDCEKYKGKHINTYIFILKHNQFIKLAWDWDKDSAVTQELKTELKHALIKHFSDNHLEIYNYLCVIKDKRNNGKYWGGEGKASTPFEYISTKMKDLKMYPDYIINVFVDFHEKWARSKQEVKHIIDNKEHFMEHLYTKLEKACDSYFGLSKLAKSDEDF